MTVLTCEKCDTQFDVPESALIGGRKVRCTQCYHVWHQADPNAADAQVESIQTPPEEKPQNFSDILDSENNDDDAAKSTLSQGADSGGITISEEKEPEKQSKQTVIALLAGIVLMILIITLALQKTMVSTFPQTTPLYEAMGIKSEPVWKGLKIQEGIAIIRPIENGEMLYIETTVINIADQKKRVPPFKIDLTDPDTDEVLQTWTPDMARITLSPGDKHQVKLGFTDVQHKRGKIKVYFRPFE